MEMIYKRGGTNVKEIRIGDKVKVVNDILLQNIKNGEVYEVIDVKENIITIKTNKNVNYSYSINRFERI